MEYMNVKDISLIVLGATFVGGLAAVEVMAGLYPNKVIYTIPAPELPVRKGAEYCRENLGTKQTDEALEKQCQRYINHLNECIRRDYGFAEKYPK